MSQSKGVKSFRWKLITQVNWNRIYQVKFITHSSTFPELSSCGWPFIWYLTLMDEMLPKSCSYFLYTDKISRKLIVTQWQYFYFREKGAREYLHKIKGLLNILVKIRINNIIIWLIVQLPPNCLPKQMVKAIPINNLTRWIIALKDNLFNRITLLDAWSFTTSLIRLFNFY